MPGLLLIVDARTPSPYRSRHDRHRGHCENDRGHQRPALRAPADTSRDEPQLYYPDLLTFVREYLSPMYRRSLSGQNTTLCPEWWKHAEGITRLEALWRAWEDLRLDPRTGMSVWFRDHADHHMAVLLSAGGPFKGCKPEAHGKRLTALPLIEPPDAGATLRYARGRELSGSQAAALI